MNIASNMLIPDNAKQDNLLRDTKETTKFGEFVSQRVATSTSENSIGTFTIFNTCRKKTMCRLL